LPDAVSDPQIKADRAGLYREHLDELADAPWLHAVREAVRHERWFPTIAALLDYAGAWRPPVSGLLPERRTPEEREEDRALARRGLELVKAAVASVPRLPAPAPYIEPATVVVAGAERVDILRVQALEIVAEDQAAGVKA